MARIGIDCRFFGGWSGGLGRYVQELVKNIAPLDRKNQYSLIFTPRNRDALASVPSRMRQVVVDAPHYSLREQTRLLSELNRLKLDLMHFTHFNHPLRYRGRFVVNIHDLTLFHFGGRSPAGPLKQYAFRRVIGDAAERAERVITLSDTTAREVADLFQIPLDKTVTIPIAIDEHYDKKVKSQKLKVKSAKIKYDLLEPYLIYVGQFRPHKNLSTLLEAFGLLSDRHPELSLVLVGGDTSTLEGLVGRELVVELGQRLQVTGFVPDEELPYLVAGAEAFVWPSLNEGFGLPPLEAMACGVPVVSSNASSMPEILGEAALYCKPEDPSQMAKQIERVLQDADLRRSLIRRGFTQAAHYSWVDMAAKTLKVYHEVLGA